MGISLVRSPAPLRIPGEPRAATPPQDIGGSEAPEATAEENGRQLIDYRTSMTTYPLRGVGGNQGLEFSHALPGGVERRRRREHPRLRESGSPVPAGPPILGDADTGRVI